MLREYSFVDAARLSQLEKDLTFKELQPFPLHEFVHSGLDCLESGVALPDCTLASDSV